MLDAGDEERSAKYSTIKNLVRESKASKAKLKHTPKGAIARDPRPLAWGEPRLRAHPTHYLAHTPLPQRMEGGGCLLFFVCFCPEAKNSFRVIRFVDPEPLDSRISQRV